MSDPALARILTPERLADLRLFARGATRRPDGRPFELQRVRLNWLVEHGFLSRRPAPPRSTPEQRRACITVTEQGQRAITEDDARIAAGWDAARREMMP